MRRRLAAALVVLAALTLSACGTSGSATSTFGHSPRTLNGFYETRVDSEFQSGALNGVWRLRLDRGAYTFTYTGRTSRNVIVSGVYGLTGRRMTFRDQSAACSAKSGSGGCRFLGCRHAATYSFTLNGKTLTFDRVRDLDTNCERSVVLLAGEFHRVE